MRVITPMGLTAPGETNGDGRLQLMGLAVIERLLA
jgi:hypothetical protein